jgi:sugar lactone lactonase YvrE
MVGGQLIWITIQYSPDSPEGGLNILDLGSRTNEHHPLSGRPGFFVTTPQEGVLIVGLERRLVRYNLASRRILETLAGLPEDDRVIINDGLAVPGGILFGTKDLEFRRPIAGLYRYDCTTGELRQLLSGQICSNGKYLHRDRLIDIDSTPHTITEYRYGETLERLRLILPPDALPAIPDGMRPARGGQSIVVALVDTETRHDGLAWEIRISDGEVLTEWVFPGSPRVTCPEPGELDGKPCWFFTTAAENIPPDELSLAPEAGSIFVAPA